jgi:CheY-like chemotaxis protein
MTESANYTNNADLSVRILIIDDMRSFVLILENGLQKRGYTVFAAYSGHEGLAIFDKTPIDVIVCDFGMEEMSGAEVARGVSETCARKGVPKSPFILLTGWGAEVDNSDELRRMGVDRIVAKPVAIARLVEIIQELAADRHAVGGS